MIDLYVTATDTHYVAQLNTLIWDKDKTEWVPHTKTHTGQSPKNLKLDANGLMLLGVSTCLRLIKPAQPLRKIALWTDYPLFDTELTKRYQWGWQHGQRTGMGRYQWDSLWMEVVRTSMAHDVIVMGQHDHLAALQVWFNESQKKVS